LRPGEERRILALGKPARLGLRSSATSSVSERTRADLPQVLESILEGRARLVGKVSRVLRSGRWRPFLTFPGMNVVPREERRRMERQPPATGREGVYYLSGPALILDMLAVYR